MALRGPFFYLVYSQIILGRPEGLTASTCSLQSLPHLQIIFIFGFGLNPLAVITYNYKRVQSFPGGAGGPLDVGK